MTENHMTAILEVPFGRDDIKSRKGPGGRSLSYVEGVDVVRRLLAATNPAVDPVTHGYNWTLRTCLRIERANGPIWMVHGTLEIPGLGTRDGIGTANDETEDSPKAAAKDALKVAASLFGVALDLYDKDHVPPGAETAPSANGTQVPRPTVAPAGLWDGGGLCPSCSAPKGAKHGSRCTLAQSAQAAGR